MIERHFSYWLNSRVLLGLAVALPLVAFETQTAWSQRSNTALKEIDDPPAPESNYLQAVVGATLIDGRGGAALKNSVVVIRGNRIEAIGPRDLVPVPAGATVVEATGLTLLPGLLDSHFHTGGGVRMTLIPGIFLRRGVTSARDPGRPFAHYDPIRALETPVPRLFLTGGHLDQPPPAHPSNAELVADEAEARAVVNRFVDAGGSAIKVYFRLPVELIRAVCETAKERGVPVTAHLEIVPADEAIRAGVTGIEHISSFGTALADPVYAQRFVSGTQSDNAFRREGRFELWNALDLENSSRSQELLKLIVKEGVFISPTLGIFEKRLGKEGATPVHAHAFQNMLKFTGMCHRAGAPIVVGSHNQLSTRPDGTAYADEMKLLVECGLTPMEAIVAATMNNARFFRVEDRLGSVEVGKLADLVLLEGDPLHDIGAMRNVQRVMLNGRWVADRRENDRRN